MRLRPAITVLAAAAVLGGCGGGEPNPEEVVREWSSALNEGDDERAADLFARGARVVQGGAVTVLSDHEQALRWNRALPCSGRIVGLRRKGEEVTATFILGNRPESSCDGPGERAAAVFTVRDGRIVLWHQIPPPPGGGVGV